MLVLLAFLSLTLAPLPQERETVVAGSAGEELDAYLEACAFFGFSGCVLVEKDGELLLRKGYGLARPGEGTPNTPETLYDIASASKHVTAAAILLLEDLGPHIHKSWPNTILRRIWPAHVERWGKVRDHRSLGAFYEPSSGRTRVWIRLDQERGERSLEVAFVGSSLHIFDLKARDLPVQVGAVPVDKKRLVGFDLSDDPPYELTLRGKGKSRKLELRVRGGDKLVFKPQ